MDCADRNKLVASNLQRPLNVKILFDFTKSAYRGDYRHICDILRSYNIGVIHEGGWRGLLLTSGEFLRGLIIGTRQTVRMRDASTQTDETDDFFSVHAPSSPSPEPLASSPGVLWGRKGCPYFYSK